MWQNEIYGAAENFVSLRPSHTLNFFAIVTHAFDLIAA
jgi:hypothetical protein